MFDSPRSYTLPDLFGRDDLIERDVTLTCVSNEVGGRLAGTARWLGVPLGAFLRENGIRSGSDQLVCRDVNGMTIGAPTRSALEVEDAMLAFGMNGEPLPVEHGFPVRMLIPGLYGYVSACKWLTRIEATTFDAFDAYWVERDWAAEGPIKVASRIDTPAPLREFPAGRRAIAGVAWAQTRGIATVEVRVDEEDWARGRALPGGRRRPVAPVGAALRLPRRPPLDHRPRHQRRRRGAGRGADRPVPLRLPPAGTPSRWSPRDHPLRPPGRPPTRPGTRRRRDSGPPPRPAHHPPATMRSHGQDKEHHPVKNNLLTRGVLITAVSTLAITLSACGSDDAGGEQRVRGAPAAAPWRPASASAAAMSDEPFGAGCSAVPAEGEGSFTGMTDDPVATAASNNPALSTLVAAVTAANLGDTLNTTDDITVLAPANPAFEAVPADALNALLADTAALTTVLTHHVIPGRLTPEELAGTHTTLNNDEVTIEGEGENFTIAMDGTVVGHGGLGDLRERADRQRHRLHHRPGAQARRHVIDGAPQGRRPTLGSDGGPALAPAQRSVAAGDGHGQRRRERRPRRVGREDDGGRAAHRAARRDQVDGRGGQDGALHGGRPRAVSPEEHRRPGGVEDEVGRVGAAEGAPARPSRAPRRPPRRCRVEAGPDDAEGLRRRVPGRLLQAPEPPAAGIGGQPPTRAAAEGPAAASEAGPDGGHAPILALSRVGRMTGRPAHPSSLGAGPTTGHPARP